MYPDPHIISSLAAAAAFAALFLVASKFWLLADGLVRRPSPFAAKIQAEPGDNFRRQLEAIDRRAGAHLAALAIVASVFLALFFAGHEPWWSSLEHWRWWLVLAFLCAVAVYEVWVFVHLVQSRRAVAHTLDAHVATGQRLEHVAARGNYLFHCVPTGDDHVDHIVLGTNGLYAIRVIVRRPVDGGLARLARGSIDFGDGVEPVSLADWQATLRRLTAELRERLGHSVRVMSVIVVPGWDVEGGEQGQHLLVNESNLTMLTGWRDQDAYLMNEELQLLQRVFSTRLQR